MYNQEEPLFTELAQLYQVSDDPLFLNITRQYSMRLFHFDPSVPMVTKLVGNTVWVTFEYIYIVEFIKREALSIFKGSAGVLCL